MFIIIPGWFISLITFPGVMLHEWSHKFFCDRAGIPVYKVKYFQLGNPAGYVIHGEITRYRDALLVTIAPFLVNSLFAMIMFLFPLLFKNDLVNYVFMWLGICFGLHAFPSDGDAKSLWGHSKRMWRQNPVALLGFPLVILITIFNLLRRIGFNIFYVAGLFFLTLIIVYAAIAAGSAYVPGISSIHVVSLTELVQPYVPLEYQHTPINPMSPTARPTLPAQTVAGSEAAAKDWLPVAQNAMKSKNGNAVLINVDGRSNDGGVALPLNGKCHVWKYVYASQADDLVYDVVVHDGSLVSVNTRKLSQTSGEKILYSYGDPGIRSWNVDSVEAVRISNEEFRKATGLDAPASAAYSLELSCWKRLTWTIYNYDETTKVIADISIDQEDGQVSDTWIPKV
jgi:hypothetical protein